MDKNTNNWKEFTLGNPQEPAKRTEQPKRRKKLLWGILSGLIVLGAAAVVILWDQSSFDHLRRGIIYAAADKDENGCAQLYRYAGDKTGTFAVLDGTLIDLSGNQLLMIDEKGTEIVNERIHFAAPALCANEERVLVYDVGGTDLMMLGDRGILWMLPEEMEIFSATINENSYVTVTGKKSGYKAAVCVYDAEGDEVFEYHSADRYVMTAALSRDSRTLLAITMGQENGYFTSYGVFYRTNSTEELTSVGIGGLVYDVGWVDGAFCVVTEEGVRFLSDDGELLGSYNIGSDYLRRCSMGGNGYVALLLSHYRNGTQNQLIAIDSKGSELGCCEVEGEVLSVSSAGRYTAILCSDYLTIYDKDMENVAKLTNISEMRQVLMRSDGSAILAGTSAASLYLP